MLILSEQYIQLLQNSAAPTYENSLDYVWWSAASDEGKSEQTTEIENYEVYLENKAVQPEWSTWGWKGGQQEELVIGKESEGIEDGEAGGAGSAC